MNRKSAVSLGPGASSLILIFVVLAMTVLGMLSLMTARSDLKFSERSAEVIEADYRLFELAEERRAEAERILAECAGRAGSEEDYLAAAETALPIEMEIFDDEIIWTESDGSRMLDCALRILPLSNTGKTRTEWIRHDLMAETEDEWD